MARRSDSRHRSASVKRLPLAACCLLALAVVPTTSANLSREASKPISGVPFTATYYQPLMGPQEALRNAELNRAIPSNPDLAVPAAPFTLSGPLSQSSAIDCMTAAIYYEAANEPITGQRAVAQVVINRMRHPAYPNNVCDVVFQGSERRTGCQFTFTCDGSLARRPSRNGWLRAQTIAYSALSGLVEPSVGHATHYHASYVLPYWAKSLTKLNVVGSHIFYQWRGPWANPKSFSDAYSGKETLPQLAQAALGEYLLAAYPEDVTAPPTQLGLGEIDTDLITPVTSERELKSDMATGKLNAAELNGSGLTVSQPQLLVPSGRLKDDRSAGLLGEQQRPLAQ